MCLLQQGTCQWRLLVATGTHLEDDVFEMPVADFGRDFGCSPRTWPDDSGVKCSRADVVRLSSIRAEMIQ
jgi:hypothetical protein